MSIDAMLAKYDGTTPGGCDSCDAEQKLRNDNGIWRLTIMHDDWCPFIAQHQKMAKKK
jgi:hypothetical protein